MARDAGSIGDKLMPKIIHAVSQTIITTRRSLLPWDHYVRVKSTQDIIDRIGHEVADHWGPLAQRILDQDTGQLDPGVRTFLQDSISGEHQLKAITGLTSGAVASVLSTFISNELAPLVYRAVSLNPNLALDPGTSATSAAKRITPKSDLYANAAQQGYANGNAELLYQVALQWPDMPDALDMLRRGFIDDALFTTIMERNAIPDGLLAAWRKEINTELTLADAALAYLRSDITLGEAQTIARNNGYTNSQLDIFIGNTGEPPGAQELAEALRRGFISQAEFERGIKQSRIRNEWIPVLTQLRYAPISVADAVNAVVQNHISMADGEKYATQNGLEPGLFPILYETAGEPLSRTELEELYNRGLIPESVVKQGLAESRLKNKYIDDAFLLHERLLEPRQISAAVADGAITHAEGVRLAMEYGFSASTAEILVNGGSQRKLDTYKGRAITSAETLYEDSLITPAEFTGIARSAGLDQTEADYILQAAEYRRQARSIQSVVSVVRSKYISHHLTKAEASQYLDGLGIPASQRDYLLTLWDVDAAANVRTLTPAQVVKAVKLSLITPDDGLARLLTDGYSETDAALLLKGA